jgi:hypothetical protein
MKIAIVLAASGAIIMSATGAQAAQIAALVGADTIAIVDTSAKKATKSMKFTGINGALVGIDVRPADGMLYGLVSDGTVVTIAMDGKTTMKSKLETMLGAGVAGTVDFNPVADRLRVIGSDGMNLRANVDDGKVTTDGALKYADSDMHKSEKPISSRAPIPTRSRGRRRRRSTISTRPSARLSSRRRRTMACSTRSANSA